MIVEATLDEMRRQAVNAEAEETPGGGVYYNCGEWSSYSDDDVCGDWGKVWNYADGFALDDVAEVLGSVDGGNDSLSPWGGGWVAVLRLNDGRYAYLTAGCDYTGWG
jgi:hypothetical protein